jgi:hypothetical protein
MVDQSFLCREQRDLEELLEAGSYGPWVGKCCKTAQLRCCTGLVVMETLLLDRGRELVMKYGRWSNSSTNALSCNNSQQIQTTQKLFTIVRLGIEINL